jgi:hypothetical protein
VLGVLAPALQETFGPDYMRNDYGLAVERAIDAFWKLGRYTGDWISQQLGASFVVSSRARLARQPEASWAACNEWRWLSINVVGGQILRTAGDKVTACLVPNFCKRR